MNKNEFDSIPKPDIETLRDYVVPPESWTGPDKIEPVEIKELIYDYCKIDPTCSDVGGLGPNLIIKHLADEGINTVDQLLRKSGTEIDFILNHSFALTDILIGALIAGGYDVTKVWSVGEVIGAAIREFTSSVSMSMKTDDEFLTFKVSGRVINSKVPALIKELIYKDETKIDKLYRRAIRLLLVEGEMKLNE